MKNNNYKILIVTLRDIFKDNSSETYTVRSFIENWSKDNIYQLVCDDFNSGKCGRIEEHLFKLGHKDIRIASWLVKEERPVKTAIRAQLSKASEKKHSVLSDIKKTAVDIYSILPYKISNNLLSYIEEIKPDAIYCHTSSIRMYVLCSTLSSKYNVPFIPHFMDDWPNVFCNESILSKPLKKWFDYKLTQIINKSPTVFCISDYMCDVYRERYNYDRFVSLMHSVNPINGKLADVGSIREIIYAGSLYLERHKSIIQIADTIKTNGIKDMIITIFTNEKQWMELREEFKEYPFVNYGGFVTQEELLDRIDKAFGLLFVESLDSEMLEYTRLSMSTKIPEYLSSGKPILAIGNKNQGSIKYLIENNAAYVINDPRQSNDTINRFNMLSDFQIIKDNAQLLFLKNHLKERQQEKFLSIIINSI